MSFVTDNGKHSRKQSPKKRLIVFTEDEKSSKTYLEALVSKGHGSVSLKVVGRGKHTIELVKEVSATLPVHEKVLTKTLERVMRPYHQCNFKRRRKPFHCRFDEVWVVFDKDDFEDFDDAVNLARNHRYKEAWSNPCFELWYMLYLQDVDEKTILHRNTIFDYLTKQLDTEKRFGKKYRKLKGDPGAQLHKEMATDTNRIKIAISRVSRLVRQTIFMGKKPSERNPYTLFHSLVTSMGIG